MIDGFLVPPHVLQALQVRWQHVSCNVSCHNSSTVFCCHAVVVQCWLDCSQLYPHNSVQNG